ncbi:hypothetical protein CHS0354_011256 [Potamilus streckersoni]|uniref:Heat shock 70 kDa protein 12A n=1 Tax=Potamilus streckersoni TaxID=2493646 RepID=A0AAE0RN27_9BIVA|nr:hypothetical protein CHS0354_011256 [Potamilus streckersoni]
MEMKKVDLVVALDIGTTYSGFACQFRGIFETNPADIWTRTHGPDISSHKTKTCILIRKDDDTTHSFGTVAEKNFLRMDDMGNSNKFMFFTGFKMLLYEKNFKDRMVEAEPCGDHRSVMFVMSKFIEALKNDCLKKFMEHRSIRLNMDRIRWVVNVPSIWNESAKALMREASKEAGIPGNQLLLALEPEAAAIHCLYLPKEERSGMGNLGHVGDKFAIIDMGGGTVDITAIEVLEDGQLRELVRANGGAWGAQNVNHAFQQHLRDTFKTAMAGSILEECSRAELLDVENDFEQQKIDIGLHATKEDEWIKLKLPHNLWMKVFPNIKTEKARYSDYFQISEKGLSFNSELIRNFLFQETLSEIIKHIRTEIGNNCLIGVKKFVLVGGFSESPITKDVFHKAFPYIDIIIPTNPFYSVMKGAVLFGQRPDVFKTRISRYTYGVSTSRKFDPLVHVQEKKFVLPSGEEVCRDIFSIHVRKGEAVSLAGSQKSRIYTPLHENAKVVHFPFYQSEETDPKYVTDACCKRLGELVVNMPDTAGGRMREVEVTIKYGWTELILNGVDNTTGNVCSVTFCITQ